MDIGFYLLDIVANNKKQEEIIQSINGLCEVRPYDNIVLFNNQAQRISLQNKFYTLHINQAKYFDGILFVFDTKSAMLTQTFPSPKKQLLYIDQPEWNKNTNIPYGFWYNIYMKDNFELFTDNQSTFDLCQICWKEPISLISQMDKEQLNHVISKL